MGSRKAEAERPPTTPLAAQTRALAALLPADDADARELGRRIAAMLDPPEHAAPLSAVVRRDARVAQVTSQQRERARVQAPVRRPVVEPDRAAAGRNATPPPAGAPGGWTRATELPDEAPWQASAAPAASAEAPDAPAAGGVPSVPPAPRGVQGAARAEPIIASRQARAVLAPLAASRVAGFRPDLPALIELVARQRPVHRVPREPVWSPRAGAQLLIDCSTALAPLAADLGQLQERLLRCVGADRLQVLFFAGCPARGVGAGTRDTWKRWVSPGTGLPLVVVSDLGIVGPGPNRDWAAPAEWSAFLRLARAAGNRVLGLVPFGLDSVPPALARELAVLPWTEGLMATRVRRFVRSAARR